MGSCMSSKRSNVRDAINRIQYARFIVQNHQQVEIVKNRLINVIWISPQIQTEQNKKILQQLRSHMSNTKGFKSYEDAKNQMNENPEKQYRLVCNSNILAPQNIKKEIKQNAKIESVVLYETNLQLNFNELTNNLIKIYDVTFSKESLIKSLKNQGNHLLFMNSQDVSLINKLRLNYACLCQSQYNQKAKQDFVSLAKKVLSIEYTENIQLFQKSFKASKIRDWAFNSAFFWKLIEQLPALTTDPKQLAYLRLPFSLLYHNIRQSYRELVIPQKVYIVTTFNCDQLRKFQKLKTAKNNCFVVFTSFVKAFTDIKEARKQRHEVKGSYLIEVRLPGQYQEPHLKYGMCIDSEKFKGANVIFNIVNFFQVKIDKIDFKKKNMEFIYGSLGHVVFRRSRPRLKQQKPLTKEELELANNNDYIQTLINTANMENQAAILQMSGSHDSALQICQNKQHALRNNNVSDELLDQCYLQVGLIHKNMKNYEKAEEYYQRIKTKQFTKNVHLAEIYNKKGQKDKLRQIASILNQQTKQLRKKYENKKRIQQQQKEQLLKNDQLRKKKQLMQKRQQFEKARYQQLKQQEKQLTQYFDALHFIGIVFINEDTQRSCKQAKKHFENLNAEITKFFTSQRNKYDGLPFVHELYRSRSFCLQKLKEIPQSLNLLQTVEKLQMSCQGRGKNLIPTQQRMRRIHQSTNQQEAMRLESQIQALNQIPQQRQPWINQSRISIKFEEESKQSSPYNKLKQ